MLSKQASKKKKKMEENDKREKTEKKKDEQEQPKDLQHFCTCSFRWFEIHRNGNNNDTKSLK